jgi:transcriptional regulator with XRE-family HTH domain
MPNQVELLNGLAQAIRRLRAERQMSQEQLGLEAGIHPTWISHIESGRINPKLGNVQRIAEVLGVRLSELAAMAEEVDLKVGTAPQPGQDAGGQ